MLLPFEELPNESRLWVYQANRMIADREQVFIENYLSQGVRDWSAHGVSLAGSFQIIKNRFVVIAVNESIHTPSGCSIDASTRWLKELGAELSIDFLDRSIIFLKEKELTAIATLSAKKHIENGDLQADSLVFDNLVNTVGDFKEAFIKPAAQTWMKRFFKTSLVD
jgi:hypothetical protein